MVEKTNEILGSVRYKFNKIASDRWALVAMWDGKTTTLATGKDVKEAFDKQFSRFY